MPDDAKDEVTPSIAVKFSDCLGSYRQLYFLLTSRNVRGLQDIDLIEASDNYGRLNVWGADSGALRIGRGSLDDILRTDKNLRSILLDLLGDLLEAIGRAVLAFQETEDVSTNNDLTAHDDHQDSESNTSTASEQSDDGESGTRPEENNAQFLISIIFAYIRSLYKLSKSLRRLTVHWDHSLTVSRYADESNIGPEDLNHIAIRFPKALAFLVFRLSLANTRRRQQLQYWKEHHAIPSQAFLSSSWAGNSEFLAQEVGALKSTTWASESGQVPAPSLRKPSRASHDSFTAIARSDLQDDTSLSEGRDTVHAPSLPEENRSFRIPDIPIIPTDQAFFECSYCHAQLDAVTMTQRGVWKKHVFTDLRPYVCTYPNCPNAAKMYISRHEWLHHEQQMHQRSWICWNGCEPIFKSAQLLRDHILHRHSGEFIESQLPVLLDMCERAADPDEEESCSLCGQQMNLIALRHHVACHLEDIALFVRPLRNRHETDESSGRAPYPLKGARDPAVSEHTKAEGRLLMSRPIEPSGFSILRMPMDLSCLVLYEPLTPDYSKQSRRFVSDGGRLVWVPPNRKGAYIRADHGAKLFRWTGGRMTDMTTEALNKECTLHSVATVFIQRQDTANILAVPFDARKKDVTEDSGSWKDLSFEYTHQDFSWGSFVEITLAGSPRRIAVAEQSPWMKLLPAAYIENDSESILRRGVNTGLIGSLPLLFALPAFSALPDQLSYVLTNFVQPNGWHAHELPPGYDDDERGIVVSVFLDPSNKKGSTQALLNLIQKGYFGPFYS